MKCLHLRKSLREVSSWAMLLWHIFTVNKSTKKKNCLNVLMSVEAAIGLKRRNLLKDLRSHLTVIGRQPGFESCWPWERQVWAKTRRWESKAGILKKTWEKLSEKLLQVAINSKAQDGEHKALSRKGYHLAHFGDSGMVSANCTDSINLLQKWRQGGCS